MLHPSIIVNNQGSIEGAGLFTTEFIPQGELVWELLTPTMSLQEAEALTGKALADYKHFGFQCGVDRFCSPSDESREMNHSCDPNTWWADNNSLVARRDILAGEEITYDYSTTEIDSSFELLCRCGSTLCRKQVSGLDYKDPEWQQRYGLNLPTHVLQAIERIQT